jgi:hypothetical protein
VEAIHHCLLAPVTDCCVLDKETIATGYEDLVLVNCRMIVGWCGPRDTDVNGLLSCRWCRRDIWGLRD